MRFHIADLPNRKVTIGRVLTLSNDLNRSRIDVHRCVQRGNAHLTFTIGPRWIVIFAVDQRRFRCTIAQLCVRVSFRGGCRAGYLLGLTLPPAWQDAPFVWRVQVGTALPDWFAQRLGQDERLRALWEGRGKTHGYTSASGYDFSLLVYLVGLGYRRPDDLGTMLWLRNGGNRFRKGRGYVERTVRRALESRKVG